MIPFYEEQTNYFHISQTNFFVFPPHIHLDLELIYVVAGSAHININSHNFHLAQHDLVLILPNTIHSYLTSSDKCEFIKFNCNHSLFNEYANQLLQSFSAKPVIASYNVHSDTKYALQSLLCEYQRYGMSDLASIKALINIILARSLSLIELKKHTSLLETDITSKTIHYICSNFTSPLSLDILSENIGVNKYYISRIFSNKINMTFNDYLNNLRIEYSKKLLTTTTLSILSISNECGFETQRTFNRTFMQSLGITPTKYRSLY